MWVKLHDNSDEKWELTWPIWHMLPRADRKALALQHGFNLGDFEEYMSLQRACEESEQHSNVGSIERRPIDEKRKAAVDESSVAITDASDFEDEAADDDTDNDDDEVLPRLTTASHQHHSNTLLVDDQQFLTRDLVKLGGIIVLPEVLLHQCFSYLPVDAYATLALTSPHWKYLTRTEAVYKRLCERVYPNTHQQLQMRVQEKFNNSYYTMLANRPRVRAGCGLYVYTYSRVKAIQRDMFTDIPRGAVLTMTYYRYRYFEEHNGKVAYAVTALPLEDIVRSILVRHDASGVVVWGTYELFRNMVIIKAKQAWQHVQLELSIHRNCLHLNRHATSKDEAGRKDRVDHRIPEEASFQFVKDKRL
jgi:F-box protein 9